MSEFAPNDSHEKLELLSPPEHLSLPTAEQAEPLRSGETDPRERLEAARQTIEQTSTQQNPLERAAAATASEEQTPRYISRELREATKNREFLQLRRHLSAPQRSLSHVIHQPFVKVASEATAGTVSRPSGLLGGGLVAFLGTSGYLYLAKHLGFTYNYLVFLLLFAGGFVVGLVLELLVHLILKKRQAD
jgi:hypothetical protein